MAKYQKRAFQVGEHYLSQRSGSPAWYRTSYDPNTKRTQRVSLGTDDYDEACKALAEWYLTNREVKNDTPEDALVDDVVKRWYREHGKGLRSSDHALTSVNYWAEHWAGETVSAIRDVKRQEKFHAFLLNHPMKNSSANRVLAIGKAALNRAYQRGELTSVPHILMLKKQESGPRGEPMSVEQLRKLYSAASPHLRIFIRWMLGTAARPEAIRLLHSSQIDREAGIIKLNPDGREQNKKRRPRIKLPPSLANEKFDGYLVEYDGEPVKSLKTAWRLSMKRAGLVGRFSPYSLRHTCARWMRRHGVSMDEIAQQLGHTEKSTAVTAIYVSDDPNYLKHACAALDALVREVVQNAPVPRQQDYPANQSVPN